MIHTIESLLSMPAPRLLLSCIFYQHFNAVLCRFQFDSHPGINLPDHDQDAQKILKANIVNPQSLSSIHKYTLKRRNWIQGQGCQGW